MQLHTNTVIPMCKACPYMYFYMLAEATKKYDLEWLIKKKKKHVRKRKYIYLCCGGKNKTESFPHSCGWQSTPSAPLSVSQQQDKMDDTDQPGPGRCSISGFTSALAFTFSVCRLGVFLSSECQYVTFETYNSHLGLTWSMRTHLLCSFSLITKIFLRG